MKKWLITLLMLTSLPCYAEEISLPRADSHKVPVQLYGDWSSQSCPATVILSPGLGGNDSGFAYLGAALAQNGYRALVMGHEESGRRQLIKTMRSKDKMVVLLDQSKYDARFMDIDSALHYATQHCKPPLLVLGGHSMGASTTMLEAGAKGNVRNAGLNRFDAYIALSPQGEGYMFSKGSWNNVTKPVLMITGTKDNGADGNYTTRITAFEGLPAGKKRFAVIEGAAHINFNGNGNPQAQRTTAAIVVEYLDMLKQANWTASSITTATITDK